MTTQGPRPNWSLSLGIVINQRRQRPLQITRTVAKLEEIFGTLISNMTIPKTSLSGSRWYPPPQTFLVFLNVFLVFDILGGGRLLWARSGLGGVGGGRRVV